MKWKRFEPKAPPLKAGRRRTIFKVGGIVSLIAGVLILGVSIGDAVRTMASRIFILEIPGFQELHLKRTGLYACLYQHRGNEPMPVAALSKLDVRLVSRDTYTSIPVVVNTTGQTYERLGLKGMPVFNFAIDEPGDYTLSAVYTDPKGGPSIPATLLAQGAENIRTTLLMGVLFFVFFLTMGIWILRRLNRWAPK